MGGGVFQSSRAFQKLFEPGNETPPPVFCRAIPFEGYRNESNDHDCVVGVLVC